MFFSDKKSRQWIWEIKIIFDENYRAVIHRHYKVAAFARVITYVAGCYIQGQWLVNIV